MNGRIPIYISDKSKKNLDILNGYKKAFPLLDIIQYPDLTMSEKRFVEIFIDWNLKYADFGKADVCIIAHGDIPSDNIWLGDVVSMYNGSDHRLGIIKGTNWTLFSKKMIQSILSEDIDFEKHYKGNSICTFHQKAGEHELSVLGFARGDSSALEVNTCQSTGESKDSQISACTRS